MLLKQPLLESNRLLNSIEMFETKKPNDIYRKRAGNDSDLRLEDKENDMISDEDDFNESESTVIHYDLRHRESMELGLDLENIYGDEFLDDGNMITLSPIIGIASIVDFYMESVKDYKNEIYNSIEIMFEEFKFDIISNHLMTSDMNKSSNSFFSNDNINNNTMKMSINIIKTPYPILLHSIRPELIAFSINCFLRRKFDVIDKMNKIKLMILSVSILNMSNNSINGIKFYAQMMINRTKTMINHLTELEVYFAKSNLNINRNGRKRKNYKSSKLNLITSSMHFLISLMIKRIETMIELGINAVTLQKYFAIYGLEDDCEEIKVVKSIVNNSSNCSCSWYNESNRILRTIKYVKKLMLCVIMSFMECDRYVVDYDDAVRSDRIEKCTLSMRSFWKKIGIDEKSFKERRLMFSSKLLGVASQVSKFNEFLENFKNEIIDRKLQDNFEDIIDEDLEVVNERNEDERIRELSRMVEQISVRLDMIELGVNNEREVHSLKNEVNKFYSYYNEIASGKQDKDRDMDEMGKSNRELRRLRMSEVLVGESEERKVEFNKRRSSGINFNIVSVVKEKDETERDNADAIDVTEDTVRRDEEFQHALEKLCLGKSSGTAEAKKDGLLNTGFTSPETDGYLQFRQELQSRLEQEQCVEHEV